MLRLLWFSVVVTTIIAASQAYSDFDECNTLQCSVVANKLDKRLNYKIHPCEDFRKHTCGSHDTRGRGTSVADAFDDLDTVEGNDNTIFRNILDQRLSVNVKIRSLDIEREIFKSCTNYGVRNPDDQKQYYQNLPEKAKILDHLEVQHHAGNEHWVSSDRYYAERGYGYAFFELKIVETYDHVRSNLRFIQIAPPTDNIMEIRSLFGKKYEYKSSSYQSKSTREMINFLSELNVITQQNGGRTEDGSLNSTELHSIEEWDRRWADKARGHDTARIEWERTIRQLFNVAGVDAPKSNVEIIVKEEKYFQNLFELLSSSSVNTIENYVNLRYISKTIGLVDEEYMSYSLIPSIKKLKCVPGLFVGTAYAYAKSYFAEHNQFKLKHIFEDVRRSIINHLGSNNDDSTDDATRNFVKKLSNAKVMYGYPDWLLKEDIVANLYPERITVNERYFSNEDMVYSSVLKHNLKAYRNYSLAIIDINELFKAFTSDKISIFEKNTNDIVLPVRVFSEANFPFFSSLLYDPMNYGSAAAILATEIYNKWLDSVADSDNVTDCVKNLLPPGLTQKQTDIFKRRATAYLLGIRTAYEVWPNKNSYPIFFPSIGAILDSRLFFLSFAETLCDGKQIDQSDNMENPMYPADFINAVLSHMKEFKETFVCDDRHRMTRRQMKCNPLQKYELKNNN